MHSEVWSLYFLRQSRGFGNIAVEKYGSYHTGGAQAELETQGEVEDEDAGDAGDDDREAAREPLQDVVSVLDGRRHQQTPACTAELSANIRKVLQCPEKAPT